MFTSHTTNDPECGENQHMCVLNNTAGHADWEYEQRNYAVFITLTMYIDSHYHNNSTCKLDKIKEYGSDKHAFCGL